MYFKKLQLIAPGGCNVLPFDHPRFFFLRTKTKRPMANAMGLRKGIHFLGRFF
ncbi:hypothetical protein LLG95_13350 [bacterium]|nr:hypothetical protein [bacterium]